MAQSMVLVSYSTVLSKIVSLDLLYMQVLLPHQCVGKLSKVCDPFLQKYSSAEIRVTENYSEIDTLASPSYFAGFT